MVQATGQQDWKDATIEVVRLLWCGGSRPQPTCRVLDRLVRPIGRHELHRHFASKQRTAHPSPRSGALRKNSGFWSCGFFIGPLFSPSTAAPSIHGLALTLVSDMEPAALLVLVCCQPQPPASSSSSLSKLLPPSWQCMHAAAGLQGPRPACSTSLATRAPQALCKQAARSAPFAAQRRF